MRSAAAILLAAVVIPLLAIEGLFRLEPMLLERWSHRPAQATDPQQIFTAHPKFGISGNSSYRGHDSRGWRNSAAPEKADVVVFGDSQTYGLNVDLERAWPQQLETKLRRHVYQLAIGGAGPFNHALMIDDALALKPSLVLASVYFGNDLVDSYRWAHGAVPFAYRIGMLPVGLQALVRAADPGDLREIRQAEDADPRQMRHSFLDCQSPRPVPAAPLQAVGSVPALPVLLPLAYGESEAVRVLMTESIAFRTIYVRLKTPAWVRKSAPLYTEPVCVLMKSPSAVSTILAPAYRMVGLDTSDARVREGARLTLASLLHMRDRARAAGTEFLVVFIPTKELAFRQAFLDSGQRSDSLDAVWKAEIFHRSRLLTELERRGVRVVDTLPGLTEAIARGINPYPLRNGDPRNDADGHPRAEGYEILAEQVARAIRNSPAWYSKGTGSAQR
jgi:hypothetical protein